MPGASGHYPPYPSRAERQSWRDGQECFLEDPVSRCTRERGWTSAMLTDLGVAAAAGLAAEVV